MGFGLNYDTAGGGDIVPIVKYDAKAGRLFRVDRADGQNTPVDITRSFKAIFDMENVEVGYINFPTGAAPDFVMVPLGTQMPARPTDQHKQGVRILLKLSKECGGDVRELSTCAKAAMRGMDEMHTAYEAGKQANPGKLPIVILKDTIPITSGEGARKSTNYQPIFEIAGWAPRPIDLVFKGRSKAAAQPASTQKTPPATGSTKVDAPTQQAKQPEMAAADDFG